MKIKSKIIISTYTFVCIWYLNSLSKKGKFEKPDMNLKRPITTFDRVNTVEKIRNDIIANNDLFMIYSVEKFILQN